MIGSIHELIKINKYTNNIIIILECIYVITTFILLIVIKQDTHGITYIFILLLHTWASDVGGYVFGSFGTHKLTKISPKKTWEGILGSMFFCVCIGWFLKKKIHNHLEIDYLIVSIIICISSILGDLLMSKIKRMNNKQESGWFLPGHGGFLDRLDSLFFATPIYYFIICI